MMGMFWVWRVGFERTGRHCALVAAYSGELAVVIGAAT